MAKLNADLERKPPRKTQVARPWDHHAIVVNFDGILRSCGVSDPVVRRRMTIGMVTGIGWRQFGFEYNFNAIKVGKSWSGPWYALDAKEEDEAGNQYIIRNDAWRAYDSWRDAVDGWFEVVNQPWRTARPLLDDPNVSDGEWWAAMGRDRWYTAKKDPVAWGNSIGARVKKELAAATQAELEAAAAINVGGDTVPFAGSAPIIGVVAVGALVVFLLLAVR